MPKPMYVWTGTAWVSVASEVESLATYATQSYADSQPGMKLIVPSSVSVGSGSGSVGTQGTVTFSGASSISINDVFSTTYDNYKILINSVTSSTSAQGLRFRMRVSGSDNSSSNYRYAGNYNADTSASPTTGGIGSNNTTTSARAGGTSSTAGYYSPCQIELQNPFNSKHTGYIFQNYYYDQTGSGGYTEQGAGAMTVTTSYTGITFYADAGNLTGTLSIYGYKKG